MKHSWYLFRAEIQREWILLKRYPLDTVSNMVVFSLVSLGGWWALRAAFFANQGVEAASSTLLWPLILSGLGAASSSLQRDMELGTIEQLYLSAPSVLHLLNIRVLSAALHTILFSLPLFIAGAYILGGSLMIRWLGAVLLPVFISLHGIGLLLAGLALRYRRLGALTNLLYLGVMALAVVQSPWPLLQYAVPMLGISASANVLHTWAWRYLAAFIYFWLGARGFRQLERRAKQYGVIGRY